VETPDAWQRYGTDEQLMHQQPDHPDPSAVFTPASATAEGMYANRHHARLEREFREALGEAGRHIALYGCTGVGKTSLVEHVCGEDGVRYVTADCGGTVDDILGYTLSQLDTHLPTGTVQLAERSREANAGLRGVFSGGAKRQSGSEEHYAPFTGPVEVAVVDALVAAEISILFVDNLEELTGGQSEQRRLCRLIKLCSGRTRDLGRAAPRVILVGPGNVIDEILLLDDGAARRTSQIEVPRMQAPEVEDILFRGQEMLHVEFEDKCRSQIVEQADGFPYYAHLVALHCVRKALSDGRRLITSTDFEISLAAILAACSRSLREAYNRATRAPGQPALRQAALAALTDGVASELSLHDVQSAFLERFPQYERIQRVQFISGILKEFRDTFGILEDAWLDDGRRGYRFHDPLMRVYVRLRALRDRQAADASWRASLPSVAN
jgi:ATPase family associated with various cellular activities (AAA)